MQAGDIHTGGHLATTGGLLLSVAKLIKVPFFFVAVGSQPQALGGGGIDPARLVAAYLPKMLN